MKIITLILFCLFHLISWGQLKTCFIKNPNSVIKLTEEEFDKCDTIRVTCDDDFTIHFPDQLAFNWIYIYYRDTITDQFIKSDSLHYLAFEMKGSAEKKIECGKERILLFNYEYLHGKKSSILRIN